MHVTSAPCEKAVSWCSAPCTAPTEFIEFSQGELSIQNSRVAQERSTAQNTDRTVFRRTHESRRKLRARNCSCPRTAFHNKFVFRCARIVLFTTISRTKQCSVKFPPSLAQVGQVGAASREWLGFGNSESRSGRIDKAVPCDPKLL